jgi:DNA polymerase V
MNAPTIHMGLPSPGTDFIDFTLDLNQFLIKNPTATFFMELQTNSLCKEGFFKKDILVLDRSLTLPSNMYGVFESEGSFKIKKLPQVKEGEIFWGTVTGVARKLI